MWHTASSDLITDSHCTALTDDLTGWESDFLAETNRDTFEVMIRVLSPSAD